METIGDGIAVIQGSAEWPGYVAFRQNAQFFYLIDVEVPRAALVIDGKAKTSTIFLATTYRLESSEGPILLANDVSRRVTGIESVYLITPAGYENLSAMAPVAPAAIENLMREAGIGEPTKGVP